MGSDSGAHVGSMYSTVANKFQKNSEAAQLHLEYGPDQYTNSSKCMPYNGNNFAFFVSLAEKLLMYAERHRDKEPDSFDILVIEPSFSHSSLPF